MDVNYPASFSVRLVPGRSRYDSEVHQDAPARLTLPSGSRVRRHNEVRRVFDRGRSGASGPVVAYVFRRADELPSRYGLVVGKRWGNAVQRNRTRRLMRESFRLERPELPVGFDVLLLPRDPLHKLGLADVQSHVKNAIHAATRRFRRDGEGTARPRTSKRRGR